MCQTSSPNLAVVGAAGPGAAVAGFAVGCAADWGLAKAVELARREDTEEDVAAAFELTVGEWTDALAEVLAWLR